MKLLYGNLIAAEILSALKADISASKEKPGLAVVLVGENQASQIYVGLKEKRAKEIGMNFFLHKFPSQTSQAEILQCLAGLNANEQVHGIIVQLPLPEGFKTQAIISAIDPRKDVDGFHPVNVAKFLQSQAEIWPVFPSAIVKLLESSGENLLGKSALVLGNSQQFGAVMVSALEQKGLSAQFLVAGEIPSQLGKIKTAEVLISALGSPERLKGQMLKEGALMIDGGIEKVGDRVLGDVDFGSTKGLSGYLTPVPGGVGPVTIACLLENTWLAFKARK